MKSNLKDPPTPIAKSSIQILGGKSIDVIKCTAYAQQNFHIFCVGMDSKINKEAFLSRAIKFVIFSQL